MNKHTPGPWRWLNYPDGRKLLAAPSRAVIHCPDGPMTCDEDDARVIAAAPDLLTALHNAADWLEVTLSPCDPGCECVLHCVQAAIAKAEGR